MILVKLILKSSPRVPPKGHKSVFDQNHFIKVVAAVPSWRLPAGQAGGIQGVDNAKQILSHVCLLNLSNRKGHSLPRKTGSLPIAYCHQPSTSRLSLTLLKAGFVGIRHARPVKLCLPF